MHPSNPDSASSARRTGPTTPHLPASAALSAGGTPNDGVLQDVQGAERPTLIPTTRNGPLGTLRARLAALFAPPPDDGVTVYCTCAVPFVWGRDGVCLTCNATAPAAVWAAACALEGHLP